MLLGIRTRRRVSRLAWGGFTILEATVAIGLLAVLMTTAVQMLRLASRQQQAVERRAVALQTVQAVAELAGNILWDDLSPARLDELAIPDSVRSYLPDGQLNVSIVDENEPLSKRISIEIQTKSVERQTGRAARMTTWVFPEWSQSAE